MENDAPVGITEGDCYSHKAAVWDFTGHKHLSSLCTDGMWQLEELGSLIKTTIEEEQKNLDKNIADSIKRSPEKHAGEVEEDYSIDIYFVDEIFRRSLYYSYIVTIYSLFEKKCSKIRDWARKHTGIKISYKKFNDCGFQDKLNKTWEQLQVLREIRNAIVHHEGYIKGKALKTIEAFINQENGSAFISLRGDNRIEIKHEYGLFLLKKMSEFLFAICEAILIKEQNKEILD